MANWLNDLRADKRQVKDRILALGQAEASRRTGMSEMQISRFVRGRGTNSAADLYQLAAGVGLTVVLVPDGARVQVEGELFSIPQVRKANPGWTHAAAFDRS